MATEKTVNIMLPDFTNNQVRVFKIGLGLAGVLAYYRVVKSRQQLDHDLVKTQLLQKAKEV